MEVIFWSLKPFCCISLPSNCSEDAIYAALFGAPYDTTSTSGAIETVTVPWQKNLVLSAPQLTLVLVLT